MIDELRHNRTFALGLLSLAAALSLWLTAKPAAAQTLGAGDFDPQVAPAAYSTQVTELPEQMPVIPVCPPAEPYVLPGDPNAPVMIDNQPNAQIPLQLQPAQGGSFVQFLRENVLPPLVADIDYLPRFNKSGVGFIEAESSATIPLFQPTSNWTLFATPYSKITFVDGPVTPDVPPRLLDTEVLVSLVGEIQNDWLVAAAAAPGFHTDGTNLTVNGFRVPFYSFVGYRFTPTFFAGGGISYLQMRQVGWFPVVGIIWMPDENTRVDLIPPKPRVSHRFQVGQGFERWWYFAGEWGGGQWAVRREDGQNDLLDYRDFRVMNGIEQRSTVGGFGGFIEFGYVFDRRFEYASGTPYFEPGNTAMIRLGLER